MLHFILRKNIGNISFLIAGDGSLRDHLYKKTIEKGLEKQVKFLGALDKQEMLNFYNSIDIYVSTSLSDGGLASSTAEAMSFERIVLVSDNSDNKKWIKNAINGYLFKNGNAIQLAEKVEYILKNQNNAKEIAKLSRTTIKNIFLL